MSILFEQLLEALDLDNKEFIPTGLRDDRAKDVLDSVIGQLSDGIWEDSPAMNKYWKYAHIDFIDGEINIVIDNSWGSGFKGKSPEEIKKWFARKVKQIIKEEGLDWKRGNEKFVEYMHGDVTVRDAYRVYDKLLGRIDRITESLDSMWIIIPAERRYDDLTSSDYDKFIRKYGIFNSRQECWDKIDELAPDRWDAFVPLRIDGDDSLSEDYTSTQSRTDKIIDFLAEHDQAWEDCCNYFGLDPWDEDALLKVNPTDLEDWIAEHDQLYSDLKNSLNESMNKEELNAKAAVIQYLNHNEYKYSINGVNIASLLKNFDFKLTEDPDIVGYVDLNTKHVVLNRNLSMKDAIKSILGTLREKSFKQALKDPEFIQQMKDTNKEAEKYMHYNESLNEAVNHENDEINSLLRQYVGKKNIPNKARKAIEDAGIKITSTGNRIGFEGPNGKKLTAVRTKGDTTDRIGPKRPMHHGKGYYGAEGYDDNKRTDYWDLHNKKNYTWSSDGVQYPRNIYKDSWDKVDLKGYLDSDRDNNYEDYNDISNPGYLGRYNKYAEEQREEAKSLRPYSDKYKHLKSQLSATKYKRDVQTRLKQTYDRGLDQEEDKYNKQIPKHIRDSKKNHEAKSKNKQ